MGISSGASLGATLGIVLNVGKGLSTNFISITAFIGALGTSFLVLLEFGVKGRANSVKLLLAGLAIASLSSALTSFIIWMSNSPSEAAQRVSFWLMGSLEPAKWSHISFMTPIVIGIYLLLVSYYIFGFNLCVGGNNSFYMWNYRFCGSDNSSYYTLYFWDGP